MLYIGGQDDERRCGDFSEEPDEDKPGYAGFRKNLRGDESRKKITDKLKENLRKYAKKKYFLTIA
jgi:hypothetical protein